MKNILVTGGAGFIGSNFVRMALDEHPGCRVVNLDRLTYAGNLENLEGYLENGRHVFVRGDIRDEALVAGILEDHRIDWVVHFAAESHVDRSITGPRVFIDTNVSGTLTLLEAARKRGVEKFLQVSTDEVYGSLGREGRFTETTPLCPNSPYAASKAAADHLVGAFAHTYGLPCNITRCSNNYGPYQFPEKLIPLMIHNALRDRPLPVYGDGANVRDWIYVRDHCTAVWAVLARGLPGRVYNVGGCCEKPNIEVVRIILGHLGKPESLIRYVADRPGHDLRYAIDASRIMEELGWRPSVTFEQGMRATIDWYLRNDAWLSRVVSGDYQKYYETMYGQRGQEG